MDGIGYFCKKPKVMNLQQIVEPLAKIIDSTFRSVLVPISDGANWAVIVLGIVGLFLWLKMQKDFNAKAKRDNTLA